MIIIDTIGIAGFAFLVLAGIHLTMELGVRWGRRNQHKAKEARSFGPVEAGVFSLLALLIAFTFGDAMTRWELRRQLVVQEANAISEVYLRTDMLENEDRSVVRAQLQRYVEARIDLYSVLHQTEAPVEETRRVELLQDSIWRSALAAASAQESNTAELLLLPSLNQMIDITTTRAAITRAHPPPVIYLVLSLHALVCALIAGYGIGMHARRSVVHMVAFALATSFSIWMIMELELPRRGMVRLDPNDKLLHELRVEMDRMD
jgi:hypothetical protein